MLRLRAVTQVFRGVERRRETLGALQNINTLGWFNTLQEIAYCEYFSGKSTNWEQWGRATAATLAELDAKVGFRLIQKQKTFMAKVNKIVNTVYRIATGEELGAPALSAKRAVGEFLAELAARCGVGTLALVFESDDSPTIGTYDWWRCVPAERRKNFMEHLRAHDDICGQYRASLRAPAIVDGMIEIYAGIHGDEAGSLKQHLQDMKERNWPELPDVTCAQITEIPGTSPITEIPVPEGTAGPSEETQAERTGVVTSSATDRAGKRRKVRSTRQTQAGGQTQAGAAEALQGIPPPDWATTSTGVEMDVSPVIQAIEHNEGQATRSRRRG